MLVALHFQYSCCCFTVSYFYCICVSFQQVFGEPGTTDRHRSNPDSRHKLLDWEGIISCCSSPGSLLAFTELITMEFNARHHLIVVGGEAVLKNWFCDVVLVNLLLRLLYSLTSCGAEVTFVNKLASHAVTAACCWQMTNIVELMLIHRCPVLT